MEKYQFDENFINQGWSEMRTTLDKEMPEKKKKRFGFFWISAASGIAATVLLSALALSYGSFFEKKEQKNTTPMSENKTLKIEKDAVKTTSQNDKTLNPTTNYTPKNTISHTAKRFEKEKSISGFSSTNSFLKQNKNTQNTDLQNITNLNIDNSSVLNKEINRIDDESNKNTIIPKRGNINIDLIENYKKLGAVKSQENEKQSDLEFLKTSVKRKRDYQIGIFAGMDKNVTKLDFGRGFLGLKYAKRVQKNLFEVSLFYQKTKRVSPIYYQERVITEPSQTGIATSTIVQDIVFPWHCDCNGDAPLLSNETKTYPSFLFLETTRQIGIGLGYGYRLNKRWELNGNLNLAVNIGSPSYSIVSSEQSLEKVYGNSSEIKNFAADVNNAFATDKFNKDINETKAKSGSNDLNVFKRYDVYGSFGASYYLYKNLKISVLRQQGFINLIPSNVLNRKETSKYWQVQMTKYF
jgi:hypothetical protein